MNAFTFRPNPTSNIFDVYKKKKQAATKVAVKPQSGPRELTVPQKRAFDLWSGTARLVLYKKPTVEEFAAAKTVVFKMWWTNERNVQSVFEVMKRWTGGTQPVRVLLWNSDDGTFVEHPDEFKIDIVHPGWLPISDDVKDLESAFVSPKSVEELKVELPLLPPDERYVPDAEELQRRKALRDLIDKDVAAKRRCRAIAAEAEALWRDYHATVKPGNGDYDLLSEQARSFRLDFVRLFRKVNKQMADEISEYLRRASALHYLLATDATLDIALYVAGNSGEAHAERAVRKCLEGLAKHCI